MFSGAVTRAGAITNGGSGVQIKNFNSFRSNYYDFADVFVGEHDTVSLGTALGTLAGANSVSTGPHLHVELWTPGANSHPIDPMGCFQ